MDQAARRALTAVFAIPAGVPVVFCGTAAVCGGFGKAVECIGMSIVCTAGLGLLFWLPVCWTVGCVALTAVRLIFFGRNDPVGQYRVVAIGETRSVGRDAVDARGILPRDVATLVQYMAQTRAGGFSPDAVDEHLRQAGWSDDTIGMARRAMQP